MPPTPAQQRLIERMAAVLEADPAVEAAWLAGSLGRGGGDEWSDVDTLVLCADGEIEAVSRRWREGADRVAPTVLVEALYSGRVVYAVSEAWDRFDATFVTGADLARYDAAQLVPLFNHSGREPPRREPAAYRASSEAVSKLVTEFIRVLGLAPVALGRGEYLVSLAGVEQLRRMALDLMLEANGVSPADRGGALKRNALLTPDQLAALEALPPVAANRDSLLASNRAIAAVFMPAARRLTAEIGAEWPAAFAAATRRRLKSVFGEPWPELAPEP